eukprot:scaffold188_cov107-Isochrysis_galbana.AAC.15
MAQLKTKPHPCLAAWKKKATSEKGEQWKIIASRYNNSLLPPHPKGLSSPFQTHHPPEDRYQQ